MGRRERGLNIGVPPTRNAMLRWRGLKTSPFPLWTHLFLSKYGFALSVATVGTLWAVASIGLSILQYAGPHANQYSPLNHFVSELGWGKISRGAGLFNSGVAVVGITWMPLLWTVGRSLGTALGRGAGLCGITTATAGSLVGLIPMDYLRPHLVVAGVFFSTLPITMVAYVLAFMRSNQRWATRRLRGASYIVLIAWFGFTVCPKDLLIRFLQDPATFVRPGIWALALLEWILILTVGIWMLTCAVYLATGIVSGQTFCSMVDNEKAGTSAATRPGPS